MPGLVSPGTTLFHRRPDSVSYFTGTPLSSRGGLSEPDDPDPEFNESKSSLAVDGRWGSTAAFPDSWPYRGRYGSDDEDNS